MCGVGNAAGTSSTCGSYFNPNNREFSGVPYSAWDFNDNKCNGDIYNYNDANQVMRERVMEIKNSKCCYICTEIYEMPLDMRKC